MSAQRPTGLDEGGSEEIDRRKRDVWNASSEAAGDGWGSRPIREIAAFPGAPGPDRKWETSAAEMLARLQRRRA